MNGIGLLYMVIRQLKCLGTALTTLGTVDVETWMDGHNYVIWHNNNINRYHIQLHNYVNLDCKYEPWRNLS